MCITPVHIRRFASLRCHRFHRVYIVRNIGSNIRLFADDISLYIVVDSPLTSAAILNTDLSTIGNWADA